MGNILNNGDSGIVNNSKFNIKDIQDLKKELGELKPHHFSEHPTDLLDEIMHTRVEVNQFYSPAEQSEFLNTFLHKIYENIVAEHLKDQWPETAFPLSLEECELREANLEKVEDWEGEIPMDLGEGIEVTSVYQGHTIYHFPENTVSMAVEMKSVSIEQCFVGSQDGELVFVAPGEKPELTSFLRMTWTCYLLSDQSIRVSLDSARGVLYEDELVVQTNDAHHFNYLNSAYESYSQNNSREMSLHVNKYKVRSEELEKEGKMMAYAGGELDGEVLALGDLMEKLELP